MFAFNKNCYRVLLKKHFAVFCALLLIGAVLLVTGPGFCKITSIVGTAHSTISQTKTAAPEPTKSDNIICALGRLEPYGEVVKLGLPGFLRDERIDQIYVRDGDPVKKGQLIASVDNAKRLRANLGFAKENLELAEAGLAKVKAGAKEGEIDAQVHRVEDVQAELKDGLRARQAALAALTAQGRYAGREEQRFQSLFDQGAISASLLEEKKTNNAVAQGRVLECRADIERLKATLGARDYAAQAELERIREVRPVDVRIAEDEVAKAQAQIKQIETDLELCFIRSPRNGHVLRVNVRPGEVPDSKGIADIGATDQMVAVAEVYQTDIRNIRKGQSATISGDGFSGTANGAVYNVGMRVLPQRALSDSPDTPNDRRVVEVRILLDPTGSKKVKGLTDMEVDVRIEESHSNKTETAERK